VHSFEPKQQFYSIGANPAIHQSFDWPSDDNNARNRQAFFKKLFVMVTMMLALMEVMTISFSTMAAMTMAMTMAAATAATNDDTEDPDL
jgi:hypothetical protein